MMHLSLPIILCLIGLVLSAWGYCVVNNVIRLPTKFPVWLFVILFLGGLFLFAWDFTILIHPYP